MKKQVLVVGGTGLVGSFLLKFLASEMDFEVSALVRKPHSLASLHSHIREIVFDYENSNHYKELSLKKFDFVFCCLGTTKKNAGSDAAFRRVDFEYPAAILEAVKESRPVFSLVSSVGTNRPRGLYLTTKARLEKSVFESGLVYVVARPSLLLGERKEFRFAEFLATKIFGGVENILRNCFGENIAKYAPISACDAARALCVHAKQSAQTGKSTVLEGRAFFSL
jgi:uncharacterized protein YbjT (DUF2867 family)